MSRGTAGSRWRRAPASALDLNDVAARPRSEWGEKEMEAIAARIAAATAEEIGARLAIAGLPTEVCRKSFALELLAGDELVEQGLLYDDLRRECGWTRGIGRTYSLSEANPRSRGDICEKGEHTREILAELGLGPRQRSKICSNRRSWSEIDQNR